MTSEKLKKDFSERGFLFNHVKGKGWAIEHKQIFHCRLYVDRDRAENEIETVIDLYKDNLRGQTREQYETVAESGELENVRKSLKETGSVSDTRLTIDEPNAWAGSYGFWMVASVAIVENIKVSESDVSTTTSLYHERETAEA